MMKNTVASGLLLVLLNGPAWSAEHPGKASYDAVCAACHASGVMNAPKIGQTPKWKKLAREGFNDLVGNALVGVRQMPAKGGKAELTDMQVAWAVHYLVTKSDARLPEPTEARVKAARAEGERRAAKRAAKK
jgi:cytochrome c5